MSRSSVALRSLPLTVILAAAAFPVVLLTITGIRGQVAVEWPALAGSLSLALGGACVSVVLGTASGLLLGTQDVVGRRALIAASTALIAAPPAFWWLGLTRLPVGWGAVRGSVGASVIAGLALAPLTLLFVVAALGELPSSFYEAARLALPPFVRVRRILIPLLYRAIAGGFLLSAILLLGESELPFLFGFRTVMTDIVTVFAQTFDVHQVARLVVPFVVLTTVCAGLLLGPLSQVILGSPRGQRGIVRTQARWPWSLVAFVPALLILFSLAGYAYATSSPDARIPFSRSTIVASVIEPVVCAWAVLLVTIAAIYPVRKTQGLRYALMVATLLFCIPSAIYGVAWIGIGQTVGGVSIPPATAYASRAMAIPILAFLFGYSRVPPSLEHAAALMPISPLRRAWLLMLPMLAPSLAAASALVAAITFADRDVASLLVRPGTSRLMLDLYLISANAPASVIGLAALSVAGFALLVIVVAGALPLALWGRRA